MQVIYWHTFAEMSVVSYTGGDDPAFQPKAKYKTRSHTASGRLSALDPPKKKRCIPRKAVRLQQSGDGKGQNSPSAREAVAALSKEETQATIHAVRQETHNCAEQQGVSAPLPLSAPDLEVQLKPERSYQGGSLIAHAQPISSKSEVVHVQPETDSHPEQAPQSQEAPWRDVVSGLHSQASPGLHAQAQHDSAAAPGTMHGCAQPKSTNPQQAESLAAASVSAHTVGADQDDLPKGGNLRPVNPEALIAPDGQLTQSSNSCSSFEAVDTRAPQIAPHMLLELNSEMAPSVQRSLKGHKPDCAVVNYWRQHQKDSTRYSLRLVGDAQQPDKTVGITQQDLTIHSLWYSGTVRKAFGNELVLPIQTSEDVIFEIVQALQSGKLNLEHNNVELLLRQAHAMQVGNKAEAM